MDLLAAWLLYPLALGLLSLGAGLLVERLAAWRLPGPLLVPVGFAALLALARLVTAQSATAKLALPVVAAFAVAGLIAGRRGLRARRPDRWLALAAVGVFAVYAAPVVLTGEPTLAGYLALPDTGHQLALAQLFVERGPDWMALKQGSTYEGVAPYILGSYPVAAQALLGATAPLGVIDLAWLYQPLLSFVAVVAFLGLAALVAPLLARRWQAAVVAFAAAQSALVLGFALQGSIKELTALAVLITVVAVTAAAIGERRPARSLLVVAIAAAAALDTLGPAALAYLAIPLGALLAVWIVRIVRQRAAGELAWAGAAVVVALVVSLPVLTTLETQIRVNAATLDADAASTHATANGEASVDGNLAQPLELVQGLGVWLSGDYRYATNKPTLRTLQDIALWTAGILALLGLAWAIHRRASGPLLLAGFALPSWYLLARGGSYADAKVLMVVSPAMLMLAMLGATTLWRGWLRPLSLVATAALLAAVTGSSALAYHDVSVLPHDRYAELLRLDRRLAGRGPALLNEYDEFAKYFLSAVPAFNEPENEHGFRRAGYDPDAGSDPRRRPSTKTPLDMDDLRLGYAERFRYLILRRSPTASRPPASFRRVWTGTYYELWQRASAPKVLSHEPLGPDVLRPAARVSAPSARTWGARARRLGGRIAFVELRRAPIFYISRVPRPQRWAGFGDFPDALVSDGPARIDAPIRIPRTGRYRIWVEGSFARRIALAIDGRRIGRTPAGLNNPGAYVAFGPVVLKRGDRGVMVTQGGGDLRPGSGGYRSSLRHVGPIVFDPVANERRRVREVDATDWRMLVGRRLDWLEIVRR